MEPLESIETPNESSYRPNRLTSVIVASGAAFAMVLAGLGIASAQTDETPPTTTAPAVAEGAPAPDEKPAPHQEGHRRHRRAHKVGLSSAATALGISEDELREQLRAGKTIAAVATEKGVPVERVVAAMVEEAKARLATAVTEGKLTQEQADARIANLSQHLTDHVNRVKPGHDGRGHGHPGHKAGLAAAASALGLSEEELRNELRTGKTLAAVATETGVAIDKVIAAMVDEAKARLATAVTEGRLTQAQADELSAELSERITAKVNRIGGERKVRPGDAPASPAASPTTFDA